MGLGFIPSEMQVGIIRIQPPLFKIVVPKQTSIGIYTISLKLTIREPSVAALTKPISINTKAGQVDPNSVISKNYPTVGYLTRPVNLTITVIPPSTIGEQFKDFWGTRGELIGLFAGGFVGAYAKALFDKRKKKKENACFWEGVSRKCCEVYFSKLIQLPSSSKKNVGVQTEKGRVTAAYSTNSVKMMPTVAFQSSCCSFS